MKPLAAFFLAIFALALSSCARVAETQQPSISDIGIFVFQAPTTFRPAPLCTQYAEPTPSINASSLVVASWDRDSAPGARLAYLHVSTEVGAGTLYLDICNLATTPVTVPSDVVINFEVFNFTQ